MTRPGRPPPPAISIAIVGGGFSGVAVAIHLLRKLRKPAIVYLLNRNNRFARGLAYGTRSASHLLNVPTGRMGVDPEDPGGFSRFLADHGLPAGGSSFVPRKFFGEYLEYELERARDNASQEVKLRMLAAEVLDIEEEIDGVRLIVQGSDDLIVSQVVLAMGNFAPAAPCAVSPVWSSSLGANDPWTSRALADLAPEAAILLVGSGLTAVDVLLSLDDAGHRGPVTMLSRRGRLPQAHRVQHVPPAAIRPAVPKGPVSAGTLMRVIRHHLDAAARTGRDWRDVIGGLRPDTPAYWNALHTRGRRQFLRHVLPFWETHRHRMAPATASRVESLVDSGRARVVPGRLRSLDATQGEVSAMWTPRGGHVIVEQRFARVINCTGPCTDLSIVSDPLIARMREAGALQLDVLRLGLLVDEAYRLQKNDGSCHARIRYVGPLLRAQFWEATAVPELREHAARLVAGLLAEECGTASSITFG